jgi:hypothetical protein
MTKLTPGYVGRSVYRLNLDSRGLNLCYESYTGLKAMGHIMIVDELSYDIQLLRLGSSL